MDLDSLTDEVLARCDALAECSDEPGRITRLFLSHATRRAHELFRDWMEDAYLVVRRDAVGNLIGRRQVQFAGAKTLIVGSHIDTVPDAGKYDGPLGVLLGIAAVKALAGHRFSRNLDVIAFSEEEGVRFRKPYLGSAAVCGAFDPAWLSLIDEQGISLAAAIREFGLDPEAIADAAYSKGTVAGYFEAHIEQGPVLEAADVPLGIVVAIVGQSRVWITWTGKAGHAGTQPMELRRDALAGAAEFVCAVERLARSTLGLRATVGHLTLAPNAVNVVPGMVFMSLDVRHAKDAVRKGALEELQTIASTIAAGRGLAVEIEPILDQPAVQCNSDLFERLVGETFALHKAHIIDSGAGHDAVMIARIAPVAMLFIRSPGGISHHPAESVNREDVRAALEVMVAFLETELNMLD